MRIPYPPKVKPKEGSSSADDADVADSSKGPEDLCDYRGRDGREGIRLEPQMDTDEHGLNEITEKIIGCAYRVANELGAGFLEKVYENALRIELEQEGLRVVQEHPVTVAYHRQSVGEYFADLLVEDRVIVGLKAVKQLEDVHLAQALNYLKARGSGSACF
jgi:GxxExxY protein